MYVVGHSQGGWIAQLCLSRYGDTFAGAVSMSGATFSVRTQLINDFQGEFICDQNLSEEKALKKAKSKSKRIIRLSSIFPFRERWKQILKIKNFDIEPELHLIKKPMLYMWAENDQLVNPVWCKEVLSRQFPKGLPENFSTYVAENQNHSFQIAPFCRKDWPKKKQYSETSRMVLIDWITKQLELK